MFVKKKLYFFYDLIPFKLTYYKPQTLLFLFQLFITVTDKGPIPKFSSQFLTVIVDRNLFAPAHNQQTWSLVVSEDIAVGSVIETIQGYDNDTKVTGRLKLLF